ncbi:MAG: PilW family protein [Planctomycetota bacterium]
MRLKSLHRPTGPRGMTLVELMITVVIGGMVLLPFAVFMVQMVTSSRQAADKLVLSSDSHIASIALRAELLAAEGGEVYSAGGGSPLGLGVDGVQVQYIVSGVTRTMSLNGNVLQVAENGVTRPLITPVGSFLVRKTTIDEIQVTIQLLAATNTGTTTTIQVRVPMLNAIVGG